MIRILIAIDETKLPDLNPVDQLQQFCKDIVKEGDECAGEGTVSARILDDNEIILSG